MKLPSIGGRIAPNTKIKVERRAVSLVLSITTGESSLQLGATEEDLARLRDALIAELGPGDPS